MDIQVPQTTAELRKGRVAQRLPIIRTSLGGIDEINPEDVIYGEYSCKQMLITAFALNRQSR